MALTFLDVPLLPVLVGTLLHMLLGMAWYGVFAKPWAELAHPGRTQEEIRAGPKGVYAIALAGGLFMAYALGLVLTLTEVVTLRAHLWWALVLWLGLTAMPLATSYAFAWKPEKLVSIDAGYFGLSLLAMAVTFHLWPAAW